MIDSKMHHPHPHPRSTARLFNHPIHPMLVPFPIVCFVGTLLTDVLFLWNGEPGWATASNWLLGFGLAFAALAATAGLTDFFGDPAIRAHRQVVRHMLANITVVLIEAVSLALRLNDPGFLRSTGVYLSAAAVLILLYSGWLGGELVFRHAMGVYDEDRDMPK